MPIPAARAYKWCTDLNGKESSYGAGFGDAGFTDWLVPIDLDFADREPTWRDDSAEVNGYAGATTADIEGWQGGKDWKFYASPEICQFFYGLQLGNITTSGAGDPYTHTNKWPSICTLNPPSTSFLEAPDCAGQTGDYFSYKGVCVEQTELDINGRSNAHFNVSLKHDGSEVNRPSATLPSSPIVPLQKLLGSFTNLKLGAAGTEDISADFRTAKVMIKSGLVVPPNVAAGVYITELQYGEKQPSVDMDLNIKGDKKHALYTAFGAKTVLIMNLLLNCGTTPARSVQYLANQVVIQTCKVVPSGSETQLQMKLRFLFNSTDAGPMRVITKTGIPAYLT